MLKKVGRVVPVCCKGLGKLLLSDKKDGEIREILKKEKFYQYTKNTVKNINELLKQIKEIRENGYSIDNYEHEPFVKCIAYPIYNVQEEMITAISLTGIKEEFEICDEKLIYSVLKNTSKEIMAGLGVVKN